jgi:hypothetical protein
MNPRTLETLQEYLETDIVINKDWLSSSDFLTDVVAKYMTGKELTEGQIKGVVNTLMAKVKYEDGQVRQDYDENAEPTGAWVGNEKKRYDLVLKYLSGNKTNRGFSVHNFEDRNECRFTMFSDFDRLYPNSESSINYLVYGDVVKVRATVNRHSMNTYRYGSSGPFKETVLNRPKWGDLLGNKSPRSGKKNFIEKQCEKIDE